MLSEKTLNLPHKRKNSNTQNNTWFVILAPLFLRNGELLGHSPMRNETRFPPTITSHVIYKILPDVKY
jgi:hypothetical protein